jgi:hypothetical protein
MKREKSLSLVEKYYSAVVLLSGTLRTPRK